MIAKGQPFFAVVREEATTGYLEVLTCGQDQRFAAAKLEDYRMTSSAKRRKVSLVRLVVEDVLEEIDERGVPG